MNLIFVNSTRVDKLTGTTIVGAELIFFKNHLVINVLYIREVEVWLCDEERGLGCVNLSAILVRLSYKVMIVESLPKTLHPRRYRPKRPSGHPSQ